MERLQSVIDASENVVFFGGAGVSTESGIPDFRSTDGLYSMKYKYPPEKILSHGFFEKNTKDFFEFYFDKMIYKQAKPNAAHYKLAEMERKNKLSAVITQNIDGLHQLAGSVEVFELHGSVHRNYCVKCGGYHTLNEVLDLHNRAFDGIPKCECSGIIRPDVVLYEESLKDDVILGSINKILGADTVIVGGTSLNVYPSAGILRYFKGKNLVLINKTVTAYDDRANVIIREPIGEVLNKIKV